MTLKINYKDLPFPNFESRVAAFRQAKIDHQKTINVPAPQEHALVRAAITRVPRDGKPDDYALDYEIIEPTLEEKKKDLEHELHEARDLALFNKVSSAKRRVLAYELSDALAKHGKGLTDADKAVLAKCAEIAAYDQKIERHAANLHVQIEDLTEATVGAWKPAPFPI